MSLHDSVSRIDVIRILSDTCKTKRGRRCNITARVFDASEAGTTPYPNDFVYTSRDAPMGLGLLSAHITFGWLGINILAPVVLPMIGLSLVSWTMPLNEVQRGKSRLATTVQDGQLGWLAVAWSAAAIYDAYKYMSTKGQLADWFGWLLVLEFLLVLGGMFIAAGGAVTASDAPRSDKKYLYGSTIVTLMSALAFCYVRAKTF